MLPHFLRGWYDGDGHINENRCLMTLTNINEEAIRYFEEMIHYLGYSGSGFKRDPMGSGYSRIYVTKNNTIGKLGKNRDVWRHSITGKANCLKMYDLLKADSPLRLDRKWELLEKHINTV